MGRIIAAIVLGGLVAGLLDILYAFVVYGPLSYELSPMSVLQSVAAGWIGRDASRAGGWETAGLGLATHFLLATGMAALFVLASKALAFLAQRPIVWGVLYGLLLYVAMNYVVVPLSAAGANDHFAANFAEAMERVRTAFSVVRPRYDPTYPWMIPGTIFTHTILVGLPIALIAKRFES